MTTSVRMDQARRSFQQDLRAKVKKKRQITKTKRVIAKPRTGEASLDEIREAIAELHAAVNKGATGSVSFTVTERDAAGRIKSFTVDHK
jgi:tRNA(Ser,Leu) C12 N-acetylase TAN1